MLIVKQHDSRKFGDKKFGPRGRGLGTRFSFRLSIRCTRYEIFTGYATTLYSAVPVYYMHGVHR